MKHLIASIILLFAFALNVSADDISKDFNAMIGNRYYIFNIRNDSAVIVIKKRFSVTLCGKVTVEEYSTG